METISRLLLTFLLNACWQIALTAIVALLGSRLLRQAAARFQHLLWVAALCLSLCLPVLTSLTLLGGNKVREWAPQPTFDVERPVDTLQLSVETTPILKEAASDLPISHNLSTGLCVLYCLLLLHRGLKLFIGWKRMRTLIGSAFLPLWPAQIESIITQCRSVLGVRRVRIFCSAALQTPITMGGFDPLIILPEPLIHQTDQDLLTTAIGHELAHVRRRDYHLNLLYEGIYLLLSFHPAAGLMKRRIAKTREMSCDELVTDRLLRAEVYARSLVHLAGSAIGWDQPQIITLGILEDVNILEDRIMRIIRRPKVSVLRRNILLFITSLFFIGACLIAPSFALHPRVEPQQQQQTKSPAQAQEAKLAAEREQRNQERQNATVSGTNGAEVSEQEQAEQAEKAEMEEKHRAEEEMMGKRQSELAKELKITMQQAIGIALRQHPGTVRECKLVSRLVEGKKELAYALQIISEGEDHKTLILLVSAADGSILSTDDRPVVIMKSAIEGQVSDSTGRRIGTIHLQHR